MMTKEISYNDEILISLAKQGNYKAYNILFARYSNKIHQIIYSHINDSANVNDLAQEVFLKVYRYLRYFKEKSQFSTWLYRIIQNTIKNHYRAVNLRLDSETEFTDNHYQATYQSPENIVINMEFTEQIETAMSQLSKELRLCYGMHLFEGHTYEDIAKKMHCPIGTIRSRIFRARKLLMNSLDSPEKR